MQTDGLHIWGQPFFQRIKQDERNGVAGFDIDTLGITFGIDTSYIKQGATLGQHFLMPIAILSQEVLIKTIHV